MGGCEFLCVIWGGLVMFWAFMRRKGVGMKSVAI